MHRSHTGIRDADDIEPLRNASAPAGIPFSPMYLTWESSSSSFLIRKSIALGTAQICANGTWRHSAKGRLPAEPQVGAHLVWWRCGESNSGPKHIPGRCLQAQSPLRSQTGSSGDRRFPPQLVQTWRAAYQPRPRAHLPQMTSPEKRERLPVRRLLIYVKQRGRTRPDKNLRRQLDLTVPLFNVARRPRLAAHLRHTLSKPVTPIR